NLDAATLQADHELAQVVPYFHLCGALAQYRAGNYQHALDLLDQTTQSKLDADSRASALLLRAMSAHFLKNEPDAQADLSGARDLFAKTSDPAADIIEPKATIQDWLIAQTLRREADALFA